MPKLCPLLKLKPCAEHKCEWFIQLLGTNPQTGQDVNQWGCAVSFMPMLTIEISQQARQAGAATESFRNEFVKAADRSFVVRAGELLRADANAQLIDGRHDA